MHKLKARIRQRLTQEFDKIGIDLQGDQPCFRGHPLEDFFGESADARPILDDDPRSFPIDLAENLAHHKGGTGKHPTYQVWVFKKVTSKEDRLPKARACCWSHLNVSLFHPLRVGHCPVLS